MHTRSHRGLFGNRNAYTLFTLVKYLTYAALCFNTWLFFQEELGALQHTFADGFKPQQFIQVFSATIDTFSWVVLLLLFELETWIIPDEKLTGWVKRSIHWVRLLCGVIIVYAFTGYWAELAQFFRLQAQPVSDLCQLADQGLSVILDLDDYVALTASNCSGYGSEIFRMEGTRIVGDAAHFDSARWLAWTDVINAGTWILVVIMLEVEVRLQLRGALSQSVTSVTRVLKFVLYGTLLVCAAYWGYAGDFLDFWDAFLWLFAFIFIEMNVFEWQAQAADSEALEAA